MLKTIEGMSRGRQCLTESAQHPISGPKDFHLNQVLLVYSQHPTLLKNEMTQWWLQKVSVRLELAKIQSCSNIYTLRVIFHTLQVQFASSLKVPCQLECQALLQSCDSWPLTWRWPWQSAEAVSQIKTEWEEQRVWQGQTTKSAQEQYFVNPLAKLVWPLLPIKLSVI